ncbi:MAG: glycosyltransferase family 2 protein [Desulfobacterales bacterium]|nr:glycosyltransferase family 2 protein [Desulfobacterales bacterium]
MKLLALIPAFNAEHTIGKVIVQCRESLAQVYVCDDGSSDYTGEIARKCGAVVLRHKENQGKGEALRTLFRHAMKFRFDAAVTLDADGQHNPVDITRLVQPIVAGEADLVVAHRTNMKVFRRVGNFFLSPGEDRECGFRAYSHEALSAIVFDSKGFGADAEILADAKKKGLRITTVPVKVSYDKGSHTKNVLDHFSELATAILFRRSLRFFGIIGLASLAVGFYLLVWVVQWYETFHRLAVGNLMAGVMLTLLGALTLFNGLILHVLAHKGNR